MHATQGKTTSLPFKTITWIPYLLESRIAFLVPDASAVYFPNPDVPAIQLSWDHVLTKFSVGSELTIDGDVYTVRNVLGDVLELMQEYVGTHVSHGIPRSEENTYELQSLMRISYAVFCLN